MSRFTDTFGRAADASGARRAGSTSSASTPTTTTASCCPSRCRWASPRRSPARDDGTVRAVQHGRGRPGRGRRRASLRPGTVDGWAAYVAGVVWALGEHGHAVGGADVLVDGDVPYGAGLSSSAALECAVATALDDAFALGLDRLELVTIARAAENDFVGVPSGPLDQSASLLCEAGAGAAARHPQRRAPAGAVRPRRRRAGAAGDRHPRAAPARRRRVRRSAAPDCEDALPGARRRRAARRRRRRSDGAAARARRRAAAPAGAARRHRERAGARRRCGSSTAGSDLRVDRAAAHRVARLAARRLRGVQPRARRRGRRGARTPARTARG